MLLIIIKKGFIYNFTSQRDDFYCLNKYIFIIIFCLNHWSCFEAVPEINEEGCVWVLGGGGGGGDIHILQTNEHL